jgi:succinate dehydrogenase/fumarate reductase flavoprotein subunit
VVGVVVENAGKTLNFKANKAVILATGGFKANHRMVRAWHPQVDEMFNWSGGPYSQTTGDGHLAAMAVGAGLGDASWPCSFIIKFGSPIYNRWEPQTMDTPFVSAGLPFKVGNSAVMMVDNDGNRFVNEGTFNPSEAELTNPWIAAFLDLPKRPRNVWAIVDSVGAVEMGWKPEQFTDATKQQAPYLDPKWIATADTIADLAGKMGIPAAGLQATVAKYNLAVDPEFGRKVPYTPIAKPPFFAAKMAPMTHDQSSGIRVNTKMQVIDQMFQAGDSTSPSVAIDEEGVIPHLYAAGEISNGLFGTSRGHGKMGAYVVLGRVAGKAAVEETGV